jgi:ribosomal protein S18 acetylase RimI-like enzyme
MQTIQLPHGHVYTTDDLGAAALWSPPGKWKIPAPTIARHTHTMLRLYGWRFVPNLMVLADMEKHHPHEPHYYLEIIGTDPDRQGRGLGSALIEPMVERADREGVGMYLESSKESNVGFYARFGFRVTRELHHRRNGPTMWLMWRDPR